MEWKIKNNVRKISNYALALTNLLKRWHCICRWFLITENRKIVFFWVSYLRFSEEFMYKIEVNFLEFFWVFLTSFSRFLKNLLF